MSAAEQDHAAELATLAEKQTKFVEEIRAQTARKQELLEELQAARIALKNSESEIALSAQTQEALYRETRKLRSHLRRAREDNDKSEQEVEAARAEIGRTRATEWRARKELAVIQAAQEQEAEVAARLEELLKRMKQEYLTQSADLDALGGELRTLRVKNKQLKERVERRVAEQRMVTARIRAQLEEVRDD